MNRRAPADRAMKTIDSARAEVEALQAALEAAEANVSDAQAQIAALTLMTRSCGARSTDGARSAPSAFSGSWSSNSTSSPRAPPRTI